MSMQSMPSFMRFIRPNKIVCKTHFWTKSLGHHHATQKRDFRAGPIPRLFWSDEEVAQLRTLRKEGKTYRQIKALAFPDRSISSCQDKARTCSDISRRDPAWTNEKLALLQALSSAGVSSKVIQSQHFPQLAVSTIRHALKFGGPKYLAVGASAGTRFTAEQDRAMLKLREEGRSHEEIGSAFPTRTVSTIKARLHYLLNEDDRLIRSQHSHGATVAEIAHGLKRDPESVRYAITRLQLPKACQRRTHPGYRRWSADETEILRTALLEKRIDGCINLLPHRTTTSINGKLSKLRKEEGQLGAAHRRWTAEEVLELNRLLQLMRSGRNNSTVRSVSFEDIAGSFNRTQSAVKSKIDTLSARGAQAEPDQSIQGSIL